MTFVYLIAAVMASGCFYLATGHQRLLPAASAYASRLRAAACVFALVSVLAGARAYGFWSGLFAALTALMLACVLLPYLDAWRSAARGESHMARGASHVD
ncbi:MAG: hypothetical protein WDO56_05915 [Gammaproteobacteria bacterium]